MKAPAVALILALAIAPLAAQDAPKPKPKPQFQYQTKGIEISVPSADEPKVENFGPATIQSALKYMDEGAISWVREKSCINCHTTGPYLSERPAFTQFGPPKDEVRADFVDSMPKPAAPLPEGKKRSGVYYPVWCSLGLAEWDKHVTGKLSTETAKSLEILLGYQSDDGSFLSTGEVEVPHITTDFELTVQAARAMTAAPGWLAGVTDAAALAKIEKMKTYLRAHQPRNDYEKILRLQLAPMMPDLVSQSDLEGAMHLLSQKQHADGGWSLRDMSATENWRTPMSDKVLELIASLPDAAKPESDPYMTAFAIVLMRQNGVPATDARIKKGIAWLKKEQRVSGRWWMHSLYRGNYYYITYIATAQAMKALHLCGELDAAKVAAAAP